MLAILSLLLVLSISFLVVRVGAIALTMTGLSEDVARFQALSAFSNAGFTTGESENVVDGPARRRIVAWLIRAGSAGLVTAISTLMLGMIGGEAPTWGKLALLFAGIAVIVAVARSDRLDRLSRPLIRRFLAKSALVDVKDYAGLLHLREDWAVAEVAVDEGAWLARGTIAESGLRAEGVLVLGISHADGRYDGAPPPEARPVPGDRLTLYGRRARLSDLSERHATDHDAHRAARAEAAARGDARARAEGRPG